MPNKQHTNTMWTMFLSYITDVWHNGKISWIIGIGKYNSIYKKRELNVNEKITGSYVSVS